MSVSKLLVKVMDEQGVPFFFGEDAERPFPSYPIPHHPGSEILKGALKVIEALRCSDAPNEERQEAMEILMLQLYLRGYSAGSKHAVLAV